MDMPAQIQLKTVKTVEIEPESAVRNKPAQVRVRVVPDDEAVAHGADRGQRIGGGGRADACT